MRFKNIIFDFDGTLIDSKPGIIASFKKVVKDLAGQEIEDGKISKLIGSPLAQIISLLLGSNDQTTINRGSELFKKYYGQEGICQSFVYPGIEKMLATLKDRSCNLFVVSNKIESFITKILEEHNLRKYFLSINGTDGTNKHSKKGEHIKQLMDQYGLEKKETAIVGDTENDIVAAKTNSIYSIWITWGYGSESDLKEAKADAVLHTPLELQEFINKN